MSTLLIIFFVTYALIASEKVEKTIAAFLGAAAAVIFRYIPYEKALTYIDMNVIFLLLGMMMIVNILATTGLFEWLASIIVIRARGNGMAIIIMLLVTTAFVSAFLDNVTTVILIAPITILVCQVLEIKAAPVLILEAIFSNIGGTATLVGDPPNILIGTEAPLSFNDFILNLTPVIVCIMGVSLPIVYFRLRKRIAVQLEAKERILKIVPRMAIIEPRRMTIGLIVLALVFAGFFLGHLLHVEPGLVALTGGVLMALLCRVNLHDVLAKVEWNTLLFFIGLFMLVGALQENGVFILLGHQVVAMTQGDLLFTVLAILWMSAFVCAVVNNICVVIALIPLIHSIIPEIADKMGMAQSPEWVHAHIHHPMFWALALGACLGGNGSLIGAAANVVVAQIARKNRYRLTFADFTRIGFPMMILSLIICTVYMYLRYFVLSS